MAYYSIFPEKDTTIYSHPDRINMNTGKDEILELVEEKATTGEIYYTSRILIKFKNTDLRDVIENKLTGIAKEVTANTCEVSLNLFSGENKSLTSDHTIIAFPLSQSWEEGTQRYDANPPFTTTGSFQAANGATWIHRNRSTGSAWTSSNAEFDSTFALASGSYSNQAGGGIWHIGSAFRSETTFLAEDDLDLSLDVTTMIQKFSSSFYQDALYPLGIPNHGFIVKKLRSIEEDGFGFGELQYFSSDTHTIYPPKLTFKWDDSSYSPTEGATTLQTGDIFLSLYNSKQEFQRKSQHRFRLTTRKRYPDRTFTTESNYLNVQYLPATSYYSVRDAETNEVIIPFDTEYTKLSADSEGMYFDLHMEGFQPERYYKLLFRSDNTEGIQVYDEDYSFKIVR
tara:strand:- start:6108 stop:7298 length:1191 start_codon:yes stop_codon:yes gene_type:complete